MNESPEAFEDFILDLVEEIATHGGALGEVIGWAADEIEVAFEGGNEMPPEMRRMMACQFSRMAWNITPQPAHGFKVMKSADPGRNDRCVAGLDCKHKQCCGQMPRMPALEPEVGWLGVCESLPQTQLNALVASGRLPDGMLHLVAGRLLEYDPKRVRSMLEPRFAGPLGNLKPEAADMMWVLADAYDALDKPRLKRKLLKRAIDEGRGALRADALQRTATILADERDFAGAWEHFRLAQRENPDDPSLAHLEVILLTDQQRFDEAAERAKFWLAKLKRAGWSDNDGPLIALLREAAAGRANQAMANITAMSAGAQVERFVAAVRAALKLPVQSGRVAADAPAPGEPGDLAAEIVAQLTGMGIDSVEARKEAAKLALEMQAKIDARGGAGQTELPLQQEPPEEEAAAENEKCLVPDPALAALEAAWRDAWPVPKPFSTMPTPRTEIDPWQPARADLWIEFIERHPEAVHSPSILDDWSTAMRMLEHSAQDWMAGEFAPLFAARIGQMLDGAGLADAQLPWGMVENRPVLRLLAHGAFEAAHRGDAAGARLRMRRLLRLNPNDNHGIRLALVNLDLAAGDDAAALDVIARYADDGSPALMYGAVLARFRQGDLKLAGAALKAAREHCENIEPYLLPARKAQPKMGEFGMTVGGADEAWLYRRDMRAVWAGTPGALDWLKRNR